MRADSSNGMGEIVPMSVHVQANMCVEYFRFIGLLKSPSSPEILNPTYFKMSD